MSSTTARKRRAAFRAVKHIENGMVIGLGSGSTALQAIKMIGELLDSGELYDIMGVPTSSQTMFESIKMKIPLTTLDEYPQLDLGLDGADQIDNKLNAIKGGGGALFREKIIAAACKEYILMADNTKITETLGIGQLLPIEVYPFAITPVIKAIEKLGSKVTIRVTNGKLGPVITDNGNYLIDADFGPIQDPWWLEQEIHSVPGVIETGLFLGYANLAYIGGKGSVKRLKPSIDDTLKKK
ncbi:ribose-5-phosphate isomerase RpiA [Candidatus Bathyarchaeota archaeon]|nr:ribose-5-phosphate isomerase RpiA [Candidatus Bathyarchaeota archaeon]